MKLFTNSKTFSQFQFDKESDFEKEVVTNAKQFFGISSIYIDAKKKISAKALGGTIPDGFLFDLSDKDNPEFYLVEVELAKHHFYNHIFPQVTKFFGFYRNPNSQTELTEKIYSIVDNDKLLKVEFKKYLGEKEIFKFIKDTIEKSQNILLIIDGEKKELPEIRETYSETWGKMLTELQIKKFVAGNEVIYTMDPDFEAIEFADFVNIDEQQEEDGEEMEYSEEYHLEGVSDIVKSIYLQIKQQLFSFDQSIVFNPQKYYISIKTDKNIAYFKIRRKKVVLIVKYPEAYTRNEIHQNAIKTLAPSVQRFWNGPSCAIMIESTNHLDEIVTLLKKLIQY